MGMALQDILEREEILLKPNNMNNEKKAREISKQYFGEPNQVITWQAAMKMAQWKDEQFKEQLSSLKDEIQSNLCASSGFNDKYSHGYQDCGMKVIEMIDKILEV